MCVWVFLPACLSMIAPCACNALRGQKRTSEPLELELKKAVVSCHVGTENQIWVLCKSKTSGLKAPTSKLDDLGWILFDKGYAITMSISF